MCFTLDLLIRAFFGRDDWEVCHFELCLLVVGSYPKTQDSSPLQKVGLTCHTIQVFPRNQHTIVLLFIGQILRDQLRTNFSHVQIFHNDSVDSVFGSPTSSAINRTLKRRSLSRKAFTRATLFSVLEVEGHPARCSSSTLSLPSLNALCHLRTWDEDKIASP